MGMRVHTLGKANGLRNKEGEHILEFAVAYNLVFWKLVFHQERQPSDPLPVRWY